jgi:hypothetical protein
MYDAKNEIEEQDNYSLYNIINDRSYFERVRSEALTSTKTAYIPNETLELEQ